MPALFVSVCVCVCVYVFVHLLLCVKVFVCSHVSVFMCGHIYICTQWLGVYDAICRFKHLRSFVSFCVFFSAYVSVCASVYMCVNHSLPPRINTHGSD